MTDDPIGFRCDVEVERDDGQLYTVAISGEFFPGAPVGYFSPSRPCDYDPGEQAQVWVTRVPPGWRGLERWLAERLEAQLAEHGHDPRDIGWHGVTERGVREALGIEEAA